MVAVSVLAGGVQLAAQSLADVARKEEARRKEVKQPSRVLTNSDLPSVPPAPSSPPAAAAPPAGADESGKAGDKEQAAAKDGKATDPKAKDDKTAAPKDAPKDQAYWSRRMKDLQVQLARDEAFAEALQSRINALTADFSARDDPAQRGVIGRDRQKALDELARLKTAIQADKAALADLQEEARRASVPPGWLR